MSEDLYSQSSHRSGSPIIAADVRPSSMSEDLYSQSSHRSGSPSLQQMCAHQACQKTCILSPVTEVVHPSLQQMCAHQACQKTCILSPVTEVVHPSLQQMCAHQACQKTCIVSPITEVVHPSLQQVMWCAFTMHCDVVSAAQTLLLHPSHLKPVPKVTVNLTASNGVTISSGNITLDSSDLSTLDPDKWLNDQVKKTHMALC